jgi:hypothetical protein
VAIQVGIMHSARERGETQNESLSALDLTVPVEFYTLGGPLADYRFGVFAAPRLTHQRFTDRTAHETTTGTLVAAVAGLVGRWRFVAVSGELNFARTPTMTFGDVTFESGVHVLPVLGLRGIIPLGG